jgi:Putative beta-barrel porin-2, OmpL-like. bbp2/Carboxypeptidase regulatory-like domain
MTVCSSVERFVRTELLKICFLTTAAITTASVAAEAPAGSPGAIVGVVTNDAKRPVSQATVTATTSDGHLTRATVSGSDGVYSLGDLPPGTWIVTIQAPGAGEVESPAITVAGGKASREDLVIPGTPAAPAAAAAVAVAKAATATVPEALSVPETTEGVDNVTPFAFGDFTWLNGNPRNHQPVFDTKFFTPDIRFDVHYMQDLNKPQDHTIVGATESFRSGEFQLEQVSFGGDFHWDNVRARFLSMFGLFATTTPRNDASTAVGQWDLRNAYRYLSEANAGYHFDVNHGLNVDAGIFVSYIGLFSYYNFDNWTYQPSYVSSNTPWFFNGMRVQWYPTNKLKIEPWIINGWQSYARFNGHPGFGGQIEYRPTESLKLVFNNYGMGEDNLGLPNTSRIHTDDSIEYKYYDSTDNGRGISRMAFSFTGDAGCQYGGGIHCTHGPNKSAFIGWMAYNRIWFDHNRFAVTVGGGAMNNPGRYLTLLPPINGADAISGSPYFTENPGQKVFQWDSTLNFQYMPREWLTWWAEMGYRHSSVPYFSGSGGVTPPGGNNGSPQNYVCQSGATAGTSDPQQAAAACANNGGVWYPDLRKQETKLSVGVLVKF